MTKQISVKESLYKTLKEMKGDRSFSYTIEQLIKKAGIPAVSPYTDQQQEFIKNAKAAIQKQ